MAALGNLVAGIAHEVNNPIGAVNSSADVLIRCINRIKGALETSETLDDIKNNKQFQRSLKILEDNSQITATAGGRIAELVGSLRNFARLDEAEFQKADIHEGIDSTLTLVQHELKNKAEVVKEYGDVPEVYCYPNQLNQVFMNLFVNAAQAMEDKGTIRIETFADDTNAYVKISDTGKGIPAENLTRIFDPGFTTKSSGVGTGLGLSISYNIIQKHKGEIKVKSEIGQGTEFVITLPIKQASMK
jgi:signal transduction histidine kinase